MITAVAVIVAAVILAVTSADRTNPAGSQTSSNTLVPSTAPHTTNTTARPTSSAPPSKLVNGAAPNHDGAAAHDHPGLGRKGAEPPRNSGRRELPGPLVAGHQPGRRRPERERRRRDPTRGGLLRRAAGVGHLLGAGRVQAFRHVAGGVFDGGGTGQTGRVPEQHLCLLLAIGTGLDAPGGSKHRQLPRGRPCARPQGLGDVRARLPAPTTRRT